jgi:hypothetical protein
MENLYNEYFCEAYDIIVEVSVKSFSNVVNQLRFIVTSAIFFDVSKTYLKFFTIH